ncbi:hypothetical protein IX51_01400 [uncultured archaeon]|nr:hypothetical protein IX51_01400 [uncultured archaeon]
MTLNVFHGFRNGFLSGRTGPAYRGMPEEGRAFQGMPMFGITILSVGKRLKGNGCTGGLNFMHQCHISLPLFRNACSLCNRHISMAFLRQEGMPAKNIFK